MNEIIIALLGVVCIALPLWFALRSQDARDRKAKAEEEETAHKEFALEMAKYQEEVRQSLMAELHAELDSERAKRREIEERARLLEIRVEAVERENRQLAHEREKRVELEQLTRELKQQAAELRLRVTALEAENRALKQRLSSGDPPP